MLTIKVKQMARMEASYTEQFKQKMIALACEKMPGMADTTTASLGATFDRVKAKSDLFAIYSEKNVATLFLLASVAGLQIMLDERLTTCLQLDNTDEDLRVEHFMRTLENG